MVSYTLPCPFLYVEATTLYGILCKVTIHEFDYIPLKKKVL